MTYGGSRPAILRTLQSVSPRTQAIVSRFLVFLLVAELPVVTAQLSLNTFDARVFLLALLIPVAGALEKAFMPQLSTPGAVVAPIGKVAPRLEDLSPTAVVAANPPVGSS